MTLLELPVLHDLLVPSEMVLALSQILRLQVWVLQVLGGLAMRSLVPAALVSQSRYLYSVVTRNEPFWIDCVIQGAVKTEASRFVHCRFRPLRLVLLCQPWLLHSVLYLSDFVVEKLIRQMHKLFELHVLNSTLGNKLLDSLFFLLSILVCFNLLQIADLLLPWSLDVLQFSHVKRTLMSVLVNLLFLILCGARAPCRRFFWLWIKDWATIFSGQITFFLSLSLDE